MQFDALCLRAATEEMAAILPARIDRVRQSGWHECTVDLYHQGRWRLLISLHPRWGRLHLLPPAATGPAAPASPPGEGWPFFACLRRTLEGANLVSVVQRDWDRIVDFRVESTDELGASKTRLLSIEIMGRNTNAILLTEDGHVIDAHRRSGPDQARLVMPGQAYEPPPAGGVPLAAISYDEAYKALAASITGAKSILHAVLAAWQGPGPTVAAALLYRSGIQDPAARPDTLSEAQLAALVREAVRLGRDMGNAAWVPQAVFAGGLPVAWAVVPIGEIAVQHAGSELRQYKTVQAMAQDIYPVLIHRDTVAAAASALRQEVMAAARKYAQRREALVRDRAEAQTDLALMHTAELLTANLHRLPPGHSPTVRVVDYFDERLPEQELSLPPGRSPAEAAQDYFRRAHKAQRALPRLEAEIARLQSLEGVAVHILEALAHPVDQAQISTLRDEAVEAGLIGPGQTKVPKDGKNRVVLASTGAYRRFRSTDGFEVWVGRNNRGNEALSLRLSRPDDIWLHVQGYAGAHVVIRVPPGQDPSRVPSRTVNEAASLAAFFSKARDGSAVNVDYTLCRYVRKPPKTPPGQVLYDHQRTLVARPDAALAARLAVEDAR